MKRILHISIWLIVAAGTLILLSFARNDHKQVVCNDVQISINDGFKNGFINRDDLWEIIIKNFDSITGTLISSINTELIETKLMQNPYIKNVDVFKSVTGKIEIFVLRHKPLVRIINKQGENYYISADGNILPFSTKYTPRVIVASGNIDKAYNAIKDSVVNIHPKSTDKTAILASIHNLAAALSAHEYLNKYIEQIYINKQNEIELVPADGDHFVILGNTDEVQKKFSNLMAFYRAGKPKMEQGFQSLNLKYTNQVICKK